MIAETLPRESISSRRRPQAFQRRVLARRSRSADDGEATDEAALAERAGHPVRHRRGRADEHQDHDARGLAIAERSRGAASRRRRGPAAPGIGYDLHRLVAGRPLVLGGVIDPVRAGAARALRRRCRCATRSPMRCSAPRARRHRPPFSRHRSAVEGCLEPRSAAPGRRACVREHGLEIGNVDVTVILEAPKIRGHIDAMRAHARRRARHRRRSRQHQGQDQRRRRRGRPRRSDRARMAVALLRTRVQRVRCPPRPIHEPSEPSIDASAMRVRLPPVRPAISSRQRAHGAVQLAARARPRRHVHAAHRGHRRRAVDAESEAGILRDLRWLGLDWDEGPDVGGPLRAVPAVRAAAPLPVVRAGAARQTSTAYYCFCSPEQLEAERQRRLPLAGRPRYPARAAACTARRRRARIAAGEQPAIRFRVPENREVVFTDAVRGEVRFHDRRHRRSDHRARRRHARLQLRRRRRRCADGSDACDPRRGSHLEHAAADPAVRGARVRAADVRASVAGDGAGSQPLSKRHGATSVAEFRAKGYLPEALVNYLALIGWSPRGRRRAGQRRCDAELMPVDELARAFSLDDVGHSAGVFDEEKLAWVNRHYLKVASPTRLADLSGLGFFRTGGVPMAPDSRGL